MVKKLNQKNKQIIRLATVIGVVLLLTLSFWGVKTKNNRADTPGDVTAQNPTINFEPATEEEKAQAEQHKEDLSKRIEQEQNTPPQAGEKAVTPIISSWGQNPDTNNLEVAAFIPEVYEEGGTCTLTLVKSTTTVTKSSTAQKDVNRTSCVPFVIPRSELEAGDWIASVHYASAAAQGVSNKQTISVK